MATRPNHKDLARYRLLELGENGGRLGLLRHMIETGHPELLVQKQLVLVLRSLCVLYGPKILLALGEDIFENELVGMGFCPDCKSELPKNDLACQFCTDRRHDLVEEAEGAVPPDSDEDDPDHN